MDSHTHATTNALTTKQYCWDTSLSDVDFATAAKYEAWMRGACRLDAMEWDDISLAIECAFEFNLHGSDWEIPIYLTEIAEAVLS